MRQIIGFIVNMLPYMIIALPILIIVRLVAYLHKKDKEVKVKFWHEAGIIVFGLYLVGLASQTVIPKLEYGIGGISIIGGGIDHSRINLIPFNKVIETWQIAYIDGYIDYFIIEVLGNIGVFLVIGFMLPLLWKRFESLRATVLTCFLISLFIEVVQLVLPRATDVDDLLMNVLGGLVGYYIYKGIKMFSPIFLNNFKKC
ncbi:VanZ family protein [Alkaliphilus peptidifermentans]|uniref:Glycopeptide antibiotics resistance protein n=1 Tax=Alkaliphilus peptidifermentans DSM 18978 TaxID=1120976 RepID=A0A1G5JT38_9FIRM|nr:VanZ family protein [Alkaliphilus peptidifermentans]SCY91497.1 Glycopeptide antibiotics resistance protein [Alkaliphilus peptidifermentans DSM 18978]